MTGQQTEPQTPVPPTDISVDTIVLRACHFDDRLFEASVVNPSQVIEDEAGVVGEDGVKIAPEIGIWLDEERKTAFVRLAVSVEPKRQPTWAAMVEMVGKYSAGENPVLPLEKFARNNGVAYLVPFVREKLATITASSIFGTYLFPPLSVAKLFSLVNERTAQSEEEPKP